MVKEEVAMKTMPSGNRMTSDIQLLRSNLKFNISILASQMLLVALSVAWGIHTVLIAKHGAIYFVEPNHMILWGEIIATALIAMFGITVLTLQVCRLWKYE
jgi:hypothetical protein